MDRQTDGQGIAAGLICGPAVEAGVNISGYDCATGTCSRLLSRILEVVIWSFTALALHCKKHLALCVCVCVCVCGCVCLSVSQSVCLSVLVLRLSGQFGQRWSQLTCQYPRLSWLHHAPHPYTCTKKLKGVKQKNRQKKPTNSMKILRCVYITMSYREK